MVLTNTQVIMEEIIYHKIVNDIEVTWTKRKSSPHAHRTGHKFIVERKHFNTKTGKTTIEHHYMKG